MILVGALGVVTGFALAYYFGVFVLLPATLLAMAGTILIEVVTEHALAQALSSALCIGFGLQLGFFGRAFLKNYFTSTAVGSPRYQKVKATSSITETTFRLEAHAQVPENPVGGGQCNTQRR